MGLNEQVLLFFETVIKRYLTLSLVHVLTSEQAAALGPCR